MKDQLAPLDLPADFNSFVALTIKFDNRLHERRSERARSGSRQSRTAPPSDLFSGSAGIAEATAPHEERAVPIQLGRTHLSPEERQRRMRVGRFIYCGQLGHFLTG